VACHGDATLICARVRQYDLSVHVCNVPGSLRYRILDYACEDSMLWSLPWPVSHAVGDELVEIHPQLTVDEVRPVLIDLLHEGHVELYRLGEERRPTLSREEALAAVADDTNWEPTKAETSYCVITTDSGDRELESEIERRGGPAWG
jgi:hypothetical protein